MRRTPVALLALAACSELPEVGYQVNRIELATDFDAPVCRGTLLDLDAHIGFVEDALGLAPIAGPLRIYWLDGPVDEWCGRDHSGCFFPGTAVMVASEPALTHEIVHAVLSTPAADPFLEEGLAEYLGGGAVVFDPRVDGVELAADLGKGRAPGSNLGYAAAHHFVGWLAQRGGPGMLPTLADMADSGAGNAVLERWISGALTRPYDALVAEYEASAPVFAAGTRESAIERIGLGELARGLAVTLDCGADDTRGPWRDGGSYRVFALTVPEQHEAVLELDGADDVRVIVFDPNASVRAGATMQWRIPDPAVDAEAIAIAVGNERSIELETGRTYLVVFVADASPAHAVLRCPQCPKTPSEH